MTIPHICLTFFYPFTTILLSISHLLAPAGLQLFCRNCKEHLRESFCKNEVKLLKFIKIFLYLFKNDDEKTYMCYNVAVRLN